MYDGLATAIIVLALLAATWCFVAVARDRWLDQSHLLALAVVEVAVLVQTVLAVARLVGGDRPAEFATFLGYLVTAVVFLPAAVVVSYMERTRWGALIAAAACLVVAVLTLRLLQVWTPLR